ncbi:MAG: queuosine precursor transporter [Gammaproteobacteria bacterium]|nr:queuosine precursor transporter [Gammaproteobacteria bacterium]
MLHQRRLLLPIVAMAIVIVASNILVSIPINDLWTWGAFTFPFAFLITDLTNRYWGAGDARKVVFVGFAVGVLASFYLAEPRIALASGVAFITAQLVDVSVFDKLRNTQWWIAPFASSVIGTILDTWLFFFLAFAGTGAVWYGWAVGDLLVKLAVALFALLPYGVWIYTHKEKAA